MCLFPPEHAVHALASMCIERSSAARQPRRLRILIAAAAAALAPHVFASAVLAQHAPEASSPTPQVREAIPQSSLPLRLVGVALDASTPSRSAGLIQCESVAGKPIARIAAIGDCACDLAEVREVRADAVVIRNLETDRLELLRLPEANAISSSPLLAQSDDAGQPEPEEIPEPVILPSSTGVITVELRRELLHRCLSNLSEVLTSAQATPHYASGTSSSLAIDGYEMTRIKSGGIVDQLGLREGDVVLDFNGRTLNNLAAVTGLLSQAEELPGAKMTVLRDDKKVTFAFVVR